MSNLTFKDCLAYPYNNFKEKIKATKDIKSEIIKRYGKDKKINICDLENCIMAEFKSPREYF
jgi:hypothetical protein